MKKLEYQVQFTTPAFLGNAEQDGQWRTPPFKALLRQWWRVAYAAGRHADVNVAEMRRTEGCLFGVASDGREGSSRSLIRIRLDSWDIGKQRDWRGLDAQRVTHPEVTNREGRTTPVGAQLYLGYGPLTFAGGQTALKANAAIQAEEQAAIRLGLPDEHADRIEMALVLLHRYGTVGGRSRNGWGSFVLKQGDGAIGPLDPQMRAALVRPWRDALTFDWPHAIGRDERGPLIWQIDDAFGDWKAAMRRLAEIKIALRTQFPFTTGRNATRPEARHWLSYPVTKHNVADWRERGRGDLRLPNTLRFKVRPDPNGRLRGVIFHVPCLPPEQFHPDLRTIEGVWQRVHAFLDAPARQLSRIPQ